MSSPLSKLDKNFETPKIDMPLDWYDLAALPNEGQGWPGQAPGRYGRLPSKAQGVVRDPVWQLGLQSAGIAMRFVTNATHIGASWDLVNKEHAMVHMPATGVSGLDLYVKSDGRWRWASAARPNDKNLQTHAQMMLEDIDATEREFMLYLPLYNAVSGVRLGVTPGAVFKPAPQRQAGKDKPICFYGTSILQGGCASRPGMAYPSIIGRYLDLPQINLGFSGNGRMEPEVADLLTEIDCCMFVIDPVPNNDKQGVEERAEPLIKKIRKAHPDKPIVMVESITSQRSHIHPKTNELSVAKNNAWRAVFDKLVSEGDANLHYIPTDDLYGHDDEATVDGGHATDLGFYRMAQAITPVLKKILNGRN